MSNAGEEAAASPKLENLLEAAMTLELVADAVLSTTIRQFTDLWALRENISEAQGAEGTTIKHDLSLPISQIATFLDETTMAIERTFPGQRMVVFGHLGDGNLHYNLSPAEARMDAGHLKEFVALELPVNRLVHDAVFARGGSISAEHGLGVLRRDEAARYKSAVELKLMRAVKMAFDPLNLMNPGKVLA